MHSLQVHRVLLIVLHNEIEGLLPGIQIHRHIVGMLVEHSKSLGIVCLSQIVLIQLDADSTVFKGNHTRADDWTAPKQLHSFLKEQHTPNGVLVGPQALHTLGNEVGQ